MLKYLYSFDILRYILQNKIRKPYLVDRIRHSITHTPKLSKCYHDCTECVVYLKGKNFPSFVYMYLIWAKVGCYIQHFKKSIAFQKIHSDFSFRTHDRSFSFVPVGQCGSSLQSNKVITICVKTSLSVVDNRNLEKTWELANDSLCVVLMNEIKKNCKILTRIYMVCFTVACKIRLSRVLNGRFRAFFLITEKLNKNTFYDVKHKYQVTICALFQVL